ncbi:MAG TPA: MarR family transcriptional regulator [Galbitalea sp.]|nr:MarR family transcriptional regulator [Galbitalea sp.]
MAVRLRFERAGGLSLNQTAVLASLFRLGDITPGDLAARIGRSPQSVTRMLQTLETDRMIERRPDPTDGRQSLLALTLEGREALGAEMRPRDRWFAAVLAEQCSEAEREVLVVAARLLERLADTPVDSRPRRPRVEDD